MNTIDTKLLANEIASILDKHLSNHLSYHKETETLLLQLPIVKSLIQENNYLKTKIKSNNVTLQINELSNEMQKNTLDLETLNINSETKTYHRCYTEDNNDDMDDVEADDDEDESDDDTEVDDAEVVVEAKDVDAEADDAEADDAEADDAEAEDDDEADDAEAEDDETDDAEAEDDDEADDAEAEHDDEAHVEDDDDEDEVYEVEINDKMYFTTNETDGKIYNQDLDGDVGDLVGKYSNGVPVFI